MTTKTKPLPAPPSLSPKVSKENSASLSCGCVKIEGHLEEVKWLLWEHAYVPKPYPLALDDWAYDPHIWLHHVESGDGLLLDDDVLRSTNTRYWSIHDVQRYTHMRMHCEEVLFSVQYPNLRLPTRHASYLWKFNASTKKTPHIYNKEFALSLMLTLKDIEKFQQMDRLIINDQLIRIERFDKYKRKAFLKTLGYILSAQERLQLVSLENMECKRLEGVRLIQQLAVFNADSLKYLFLWRFVLPNENPILINYSYLIGTGQYIPRPDTRDCFLRSLACLKNLRVLALEYAHIADSTGAALVSLLPILRRPHFRLQLICREDQIPGYADASQGTGGHDIPDTAWNRISIACPNLYLFLAFFRIRDYDNVRRFLTPSMPIREIHWQYGIDIKIRQRQDSDISCFVRHVAFRYASTLVTLSIHQWSGARFPLRRIFELMPFLTRFFFVGRVADEVDLKRALDIIACGVCYKLKQLRIQIQDEGEKRKYWRDVVESLNQEYKNVMDLYEIKFCLEIYKS